MKIRHIFVAVLFLLLFLNFDREILTHVQANIVIGDCNGNGWLGEDDINTLKYEIFQNDGWFSQQCDANQDGKLDAGDLACIPRLTKGLSCQPKNNKASLGTNLDFVGDDTISPYMDVFKSGRPWFPQCDPWAVSPQADCNEHSQWWDTKESLDLDENGWVRSLPRPEDKERYWYASTLLLHYDALDPEFPNYPAGEYTVLYEGQGTLEYGYAAQKLHHKSSYGRDVIKVTPERRGIQIKLVETDPHFTGNYLRNIRVLLPGHGWSDANRPFNPAYLKQNESYSTLRFMDMMRTNDSPQHAWSSRPRLSQAFYSTDAGVPIETMISLSNELSADPWINIPHMADDNYIAAFATMMLNDLKPSQRVYVEYSNEFWNDKFSQGQWMQAKADTEIVGEPAFARRLNWYAKRTAEICGIWKNIWEYEKGRVVCVIGTQAGNPQLTSQLLECPLWHGTRCVDHQIDAVAGAAYFGQHIGSPKNEGKVEAWTQQPDGGLNYLFNELQTGGNLKDPEARTINNAIYSLQADQQVAKAYGLQHLAYEGGQHLVGFNGVENNDKLTQLFTEANRDPRMAYIYESFLNSWQSSQSDLFVHYKSASAYSKWGSWGASEYLGQTQAPKQAAISNFIDNQPCWWADCDTVWSENPTVSLGTPEIGEDGLYTVPVIFNSNHHDISSMSFAIRFSRDQVTPNYVAVNVPGDFVANVETGSQLIQVEISDRYFPLSSLPTGELLTLKFNPKVNQINVRFANPSVHPKTCGNQFGQTVYC